MKIVIPMSGTGNRFIQAGYVEDPKPLIRIQGKPIIEYVIDLFPGEKDFVFICRQEHLDSTDMERILLEKCPSGKIVPVKGSKLGPVYAVSCAYDYIDNEEPAIVNYCDFFMNWDYIEFKKTVEENLCDGNVVCYKGFHPHLLHENNFYASCKTDSQNYLLEIREKYSFTENKMDSPQSGGTYYFRKGSYVKKYFSMLMDENIKFGNEYYASLVYNLLLRDGLRVHVYDKVKHFMQWGTPFDLEEYLYWMEIFEGKKGGYDE